MDEDLVLFFVGMFVGAVFVVILLGMTGQFDRDNELGGAICEEEYNMNFDSYDNGVLKCKPKEVKAEVQYDGIVIQIGDGRWTE